MDETIWIIPTSAMLNDVVSTALTGGDIDENVGTGTVPGQTFDPTQDARSDELVNQVVAMFRGAIQVAGRYPLSTAAGSVPPEVLNHVLNMAAWKLVNSTPSLKMYIMSDKGVYAPFQKFYQAAADYLAELGKGKNVVTPTSPTGRDYQTPINAPWTPTWPPGFCPPLGTPAPVQPVWWPVYDNTKPLNLPLQSVRVGAGSHRQDLTTEDYRACFPTANLGQP